MFSESSSACESRSPAQIAGEFLDGQLTQADTEAALSSIGLSKGAISEIVDLTLDTSRRIDQIYDN